MNTRVWKTLGKFFVFVFCFVLLCFFLGGKMLKVLHYVPVKAQFLLLSSKTMRVLLLPQHLLCRRVCMHNKKTKIFKNLDITDIQNIQHRFFPIYKLHFYNCNIIFSFRGIVQFCLKHLGLKLVKLDCKLYNFILIQLKKLEMTWMEPVVYLLLRSNLC